MEFALKMIVLAAQEVPDQCSLIFIHLAGSFRHGALQ